MSTSKPLAVDLGGKRHTLHFDLNTFAAFEEKSGKFFLDFLIQLQEAMKEAEQKQDSTLLLRRISARDLHIFIWAALHRYDAHDEPVWDFSPGKLGKMLTVDTLPELLPAIMKGFGDNNAEPRPIRGPGAQEPGPESRHESGGRESGPSDADVLASLTLSSTD